MGGVLDVERRLAGGVIFADALFRVNEFVVLGVADVSSELRLAASPVIDPCHFRIGHPCAVYPCIESAQRLVVTGIGMLLLGGTLPVVGNMVPYVRSGECDVAFGARFGF